MTPLQPAEITGIVTETARLAREAYVFPEVGGQVAELLTRRLADGHYLQAADPEALALLVTEDLQEVSKDRHLRLKFHQDTISEGEDGALLDELTRESDLSLGGVPLVERLAGGVARLKLAPIIFPLAMGVEPLTAGFALVARAEALVVDLRECVGGHPEAVAHISAYLLDEPTHLTTLYDRQDEQYRQLWSPVHVPGPRFGGDKPLYVLTSKATFSGAEALAYDLQQQGRAVVVGERSGGGANPREGFTLHPHLEATIPVSRSINPVSGGNWEGVGITPDIETDPAEALDVAHRTALAEIVRRGGDTPSVAEARRLLDGSTEPARDSRPL
jgi:hypothetical protein